MEFNIKFDEKMIAETANRVLDEFKYKGKTIREWVDLITNPKTNADRIRATSDEELPWVLARICRMPFYKDDSEIDEYEVDCWAKWLKQEAK